MSSTIIKHTYQLKRGTKDKLEEVNPLLKRGEPIVTYDNEGNVIDFRLGDGIHNYINLVPFTANGSQPGEQVQSDYNENNDESFAYIKNRPFIKNIITEELDYTPIETAYDEIIQIVDEDSSFMYGFAVKRENYNLEIDYEYGLQLIIDDESQSYTGTAIDGMDWTGLYGSVLVYNNDINLPIIIYGATNIDLQNETCTGLVDENGQQVVDDQGRRLADPNATLYLFYKSKVDEITVEEKLLGVPSEIHYIEIEGDSDYINAFQSNWNINDDKEISYIKNRPFYENIYESRELRLEYNPNTALVGNMYCSYEGSFGLINGEEYDIIIDSVYINTYSTKAICTDDLSEYEPYFQITLPEGSLALVDNIGGSYVALLIQNCDFVNGNYIYSENSSIYFNNEAYDIKYTIKGDSLPLRQVTDLKKLDNKFINTDLTFDRNSENPQSGKAVQEALAGLGITYKTSNFNLNELTEDGIYVISPYVIISTGNTSLDTETVVQARFEEPAIIVIKDYVATLCTPFLDINNGNKRYLTGYMRVGSDQPTGIFVNEYELVEHRVNIPNTYINNYASCFGLYFTTTNLMSDLVEGKGKNLFDPNQVADNVKFVLDNMNPNYENSLGYKLSGAIELTKNTTYTLSNTNNRNMSIRLRYYNSITKSYISTTDILTGQSITFTTPSSYDVSTRIEFVPLVNYDMSTVQLELGDTKTEFEAYQRGIKASLLSE